MNVTAEQLLQIIGELYVEVLELRRQNRRLVESATHAYNGSEPAEVES